MADHASYTAPTWQHELLEILQIRNLSPLKDLDHEVENRLSVRCVLYFARKVCYQYWYQISYAQRSISFIGFARTPRRIKLGNGAKVIAAAWFLDAKRNGTSTRCQVCMNMYVYAAYRVIYGCKRVSISGRRRSIPLVNKLVTSRGRMNPFSYSTEMAQL